MQEVQIDKWNGLSWYKIRMYERVNVMLYIVEKPENVRVKVLADIYDTTDVILVNL